MARAEGASDFEKGLISLVILSCRRPRELMRLTAGLGPFLDRVDSYRAVEKILVDNGSGDDLVGPARESGFFDRIIAHEENLGMAVALDDAFPRCRGEYILLLEEDFVLDYDRPFLARCLEVFAENPEIGIIRLKNQDNWFKPYRIIGPTRTTSGGTEFWTWLPSRDGKLNVWASGSVMFRKASYFAAGKMPLTPNLDRTEPHHQGYIYECSFGKMYNRLWLAAKIKDCYPFYQPNDNPDCPGWGDVQAPPSAP